jgi:hypothetical protein
MQTSQQLSEPKFIRRASSRQRLRAGIVFLVVAVIFGLLALAAAGKININRWLTPCGLKQRYNLPCPTCGMTTSALAFVQGKIIEAFYIQPASAILCCVMVVAAVLAFFVAVFGVYFHFLERFFAEVKIRHIILILLIIMAAGWAVTLAQTLAAK